MTDSSIPLVQRMKDALSCPLRILPDDDPEWIVGEPGARPHSGDDVREEESVADRPIPPSGRMIDL